MADITALQARLTTWGKQLEEVIFLKKNLTNESNFKPHSSFRSIELDFMLQKEGLQRIHHCIVVGGIVQSDPSKLLVNLKYCIWRKNNPAYFWCDFYVICDKQKAMSKVVTRMSPRYFLESNQISSEMKLLNNSSRCRFLNSLDPMSSHGHERYLIWICPCISGAGYFPHWFLKP